MRNTHVGRSEIVIPLEASLKTRSCAFCAGTASDMRWRSKTCGSQLCHNVVSRG